MKEDDREARREFRRAAELYAGRLRVLHLFAGAGGGVLADLLLGHRPVGAVEIDRHCRRALRRRMAEGSLPWMPLFGDVRSFDGRPWKGAVDCVSGGFPCQDVSSAGRGLGVRAGRRSGLWFELARVVGEVRPPLVFVENTPLLVHRGLDAVLGSLADMGYDARWLVLGAWHCGAPHRRDRLWLLAWDPDRVLAEEERPVEAGKAAEPAGGRRGREARAYAEGVPGRHEPSDAGYGEGREGGAVPGQGRQDAGAVGPDTPGLRHARPGRKERHGGGEQGDEAGREGLGGPVYGGGEGRAPAARPCPACSREWWRAEPGLGRMADGVADRVERIRAVGNGQVPQVAAAAFVLLSAGLTLPGGEGGP